MIYRVELRPRAQRVWDKLSPAIRDQLRRKLDERRRNPHVPSARVRKMERCYKIKLHSAGIRAFYQVQDDKLLLLVLAIGPREREKAYEEAAAELRWLDERS